VSPRDRDDAELIMMNKQEFKKGETIFKQVRSSVIFPISSICSFLCTSVESWHGCTYHIAMSHQGLTVVSMLQVQLTLCSAPQALMTGPALDSPRTPSFRLHGDTATEFYNRSNRRRSCAYSARTRQLTGFKMKY
jgi:hypothetical protein